MIEPSILVRETGPGVSRVSLSVPEWVWKNVNGNHVVFPSTVNRWPSKGASYGFWPLYNKVSQGSIESPMVEPSPNGVEPRPSVYKTLIDVSLQMFRLFLRGEYSRRSVGLEYA